MTTNDNKSTIERVVMRRVYTIRALRLVMNSVTASAAVAVLALWGIGREVWVARVFENMPQSGGTIATSRFYVAAFTNTELVVQILVLSAVAALVYMARECARAITRYSVQLGSA